MTGTTIPAGKTQIRMTPWRVTARRVMRSVGELAPRLRTSLLAIAAAAVLQGLSLACLLPVFQALLVARDPAALLLWLSIMAGLMLVAGALRWWGQGFEFNGHMARATHRLRTRLGLHLQRIPLELLHDRRAGDVHAAVLGNVDEHLNHILMIANLMASAFITPLVAAVVVLAYDWRLGLVLLAVLAVIVPLYRWRRPAMSRDMRNLAQAQQRVNGDIVEYVQGLCVLRAACCAGEKAAEFRAGLEDLERLQATQHDKGARPNVVIASIVELGLLAIACAGLAAVTIGASEGAALAAVIVMSARFAEPLSTFISYTAMIEMIEAGLERVELLLAEPTVTTRMPVQVPDGSDIRFSGVSFRYRQREAAAIVGLNVVLQARSMTALVGPSGSGKSTLTRLLMRQFDPQQGSISIGGADLRHIPLERMTSLVSVVFQDVHLFDDTIAANIRLGRPDASNADVEAAARSAHCLDFIDRLPQGWDTRLGDYGSRLSGGERQRLSIARAFLKDAPIVILDEPTAALDTESQLAVQEAMEGLVRDRTLIVTAHRLSTVVRADQILVMDDGAIVEAGNHEQLLDRGGRYSAMWDAQHQSKHWRRNSLPSDEIKF
ncbi:ABC transporter ATP-binding protein [Xanthobacteraceae bacterium A53D]